MRRRWLTTPKRPTRGEVEGRPYLLWLPDTPPPWPGIVICHGAGSRKENHADFGRACAAAGWAAIAYDQRGHGEAGDEVSPRMIDDASRVARALAGQDGVDPARVCARGSSLGGFIAIHAAATSDAIAGVIAICPAGERHLLRGLRDGSLEIGGDARARADLEAWLAEHDLREAVPRLAGRPLILIHARGDERIESEWSEELYASAGEPKKLILIPGGHHRSAQHDPELQGVALRWLERSLASDRAAAR
jgi:uncharacterized protein